MEEKFSLPAIGKIFSDEFIEVFGNPRQDEALNKHYEDIAASVEAMYKETFFYILNDVYKRFRIDNLVLAGGCIQDSLANGKIYEKTPFKNVYIPPAAHDVGTAIGAAFWVWNVLLGKNRILK